MKKLALIFLTILAVAFAKPAVVLSPVAYTSLPLTAPVAYTAPNIVTATSAQYVARNYNGFVAAPYVATAATAPLVTSAAYSYAPSFLY